MSFAKADQLLELATMIRAHRAGITLVDVEERFGCSRRTAQRMMRNVELRFPDIGTKSDEMGQKRWQMAGGALRELLSLGADELAVLDLAVAQLDRDGQIREARMLRRLREKMLALVPSTKASRLETDHDALLEAQGFAARPGPRPRVDEGVSQTVAEALKACVVIEIDYRSRSDTRPRRRAVMPYGLLTGARRYLVARPEDAPAGQVRTYRLDAVAAAHLTDRAFARPEDFDLQTFANRAFGLYQSEAEYGEVVWRFAPRAAEQARGYLFHPDQTTRDEPDGSLTVRFHASGHLEMAWHLYAWGDAVEVVKPKALRKLVEGYQRNDFGVLP